MIMDLQLWKINNDIYLKYNLVQWQIQKCPMFLCFCTESRARVENKMHIVNIAAWLQL